MRKKMTKPMIVKMRSPVPALGSSHWTSLVPHSSMRGPPLSWHALSSVS